MRMAGHAFPDSSFALGMANDLGNTIVKSQYNLKDNR